MTVYANKGRLIMMKLSFVSIIVVGLSVCFCSAPSAMESLSLNGNSYEIFMFCMDDAGDYCDERKFNNDEFSFNDGDFEIGSFDDELWGYGGEGEYGEKEFSFEAEYEVYNEDLGKYELDINGINLIDDIIIGIIEIEYSELEWYKLSYEKKEDATAYFIGIRD